jgi:hypothetical protein
MPHITTNAIDVSQCRLRLTRPLRAGEAPALRGFFGRQFADEVHMHNHNPDGSVIYQYPRVQFKVIDRTALLMGVAEGSELLQRLWLDIDQTTLGDERLQVLESEFETHEHAFEVTSDPIEYRFVTPWLALNQKNFQEYTRTRNQRTRKDELARILVGNCLGMAKSLGIRFTGRIAADYRKLTSIKTSLKGQGMIGFVGTFSVNVRLPEFIGLGKSVSRGFGTAG